MRRDFASELSSGQWSGFSKGRALEWPRNAGPLLYATEIASNPRVGYMR